MFQTSSFRATNELRVSSRYLAPIACLALVLTCLLSAQAQAQGTAQANLQLVPFTFAVIADPHCAEKVRWDVHSYDKSCGTHMDRLFRCLAEMEKLTGIDKPDFVLVVGDIHPHELVKHMDKIRIPLHLTAGNHETGKRREQLRNLAPEDFQIDGKPSDYYSFVHKGCRFIGVCSAGRGGDHVGHLCSESIRPLGQCEWLERELAQPEAHKFVFSHIPPQPDGLDRNSYLSRNDSRYFNKLVTRTQPTAMFFGHQHRPTREHTIGQTRSFILRSYSWNSRQAPLGFMLVKVSDSGIETREILTSAAKK